MRFRTKRDLKISQKGAVFCNAFYSVSSVNAQKYETSKCHSVRVSCNLNSLLIRCKYGTVVPQQASLCLKGGVETRQGGLRAQPHAGGSAASRITSECPRGTRMVLKVCSDNEAVQSRGQDLEST